MDRSPSLATRSYFLVASFGLSIPGERETFERNRFQNKTFHPAVVTARPTGRQGRADLRRKTTSTANTAPGQTVSQERNGLPERDEREMSRPVAAVIKFPAGAKPRCNSFASRTCAPFVSAENPMYAKRASCPNPGNAVSVVLACRLVPRELIGRASLSKTADCSASRSRH